jgi:single-strand DNA-binding protein
VEDINQITLVARLTKAPELKGSVLPLRLAFTTRQKNGDRWEDKANYVDAVVFGRQGESLYTMLGKGSRVVVAGNLEWREFTASDGQQRSTVQIIARTVQVMDGKPKGSAPASDDHSDIPF